MPAGATSPYFIKINQAYGQNSMILKEYDDTDKAIKVFLMSAIDETYIRALRDRYVGYSNVTTL